MATNPASNCATNDGAIETITVAEFDIRDGRNHYQCCPRCHAVWGMGMTTKRGQLLVICTTCCFEGPGVPFDPNRPTGADRPALNAWNALPRDSVEAAIATRTSEPTV